MKRTVLGVTALLAVSLLAGCVATVTPEGTYLEPLPATIIVGPPVIGPTEPYATLRPLPSVWVHPDRRVYSYSGLYYYYWGDTWYYSDRERGPWHHLPKKYYPQHYRQYEHRDRDQRRDDFRDRDRDQYRDRYRY